MKEKTFESLVAKLRASNLANVADALGDLSRTSIRWDSSPSSDEELELGASRLGGRPDLPAGTKWPTRDDEPLRFIAMLNFADIAKHLSEPGIPTSGIISLFYDDEEQPWGLGLHERDGWHIEYYDGPSTSLVRVAYPDGDSEEYPFTKLTPRLERSFPAWESFDWGRTDIDQKSLSKAAKTASKIIKKEEGGSSDQVPVHRSFGYADEIQGEMRVDASMRIHGIKDADLAYLTEEDLHPIIAKSSGLRLLFQIDTDDDAEMMWCDCGRLYLWMHQDDLVRRDFSRTWLMLQCY